MKFALLQLLSLCHTTSPLCHPMPPLSATEILLRLECTRSKKKERKQLNNLLVFMALRGRHSATTYYQYCPFATVPPSSQLSHTHLTTFASARTVEQAMLDHAARNHAHPKIAYRLLDIANDKAVVAFAAREGLFERVCCFLTLHWIRDKAAALRNMEHLTAPGGECLVVFNTRVSLQQVLRAMIASGKWKRHEHVLESALPESWEFYDVDTMVSKLEGLVASTSLVALSCEVVTLQVGSPEIDLEVRALCAAVPIYPHMKEEGKAEVEEFVRNLALQDGCVNFSVTGITHQLRCVIHARKPVLSS
ncbi:juvenile hormone acid O-methyltransferase-like isoform X3 [Dermacentor andersoni]|uniref:juvenile hormone acid O-methyltransferase-like isoform X3 n=1 Tax=Dermacentor andersoni TaxID=34620 RepID=UPI00241617E7|nr:juvenile hormone acid O-methyltransferase-like isoform X3 [Dermacentor andersoni]